MVNDQHLGESLPFEHEITRMAQSRNELRLNLNTSSPGVAEVYLEVRAAAWLRNVHMEQVDSGHQIRGEVAGTCQAVLDLYVLAEGASVGHAAVHAGQSFTVPIESGPARPVRVELVNGAVVWYVVEL